MIIVLKTTKKYNYILKEIKKKNQNFWAHSPPKLQKDKNF